MSRQKDTDYLFLSARLRSLENRLLTRERMERMLEARTNEDAARVLSECGYTGLEPLSAESLNRALAEERVRLFAELGSMAPDPTLVNAFRIKYDYHNAKALLKAAAMHTSADRLLLDAGRVPVKTLEDALLQNDLRSLPEDFRRAVAKAQSILASTRDPQLSDFALDRAYYAELSTQAKAAGSQFLAGYVRRRIDAANLKSAVRTARMKKNADFLRKVLADGGNVSKDAVIDAVFGSGSLEAAFSSAGLAEAAVLGTAACKGGRMTAFEKACDDAGNDYLSTARRTPFGDSVLVAYTAAKEAEMTAARIILAGRLAGVKTDAIRERLREAYV